LLRMYRGELQNATCVSNETLRDNARYAEEDVVVATLVTFGASSYLVKRKDY
jgi:hypothetical protein